MRLKFLKAVLAILTLECFLLEPLQAEIGQTLLSCQNSRILQHPNISTHAYRVVAEDLLHKNVIPAIVHLKNDHYVVITNIANGKVTFTEPAQGANGESLTQDFAAFTAQMR